MADSELENGEWRSVSRIEFYQPKPALNPPQREIRNILQSLLESDSPCFLRKLYIVSDSAGANVFLDVKSIPHPLCREDIESCETNLLHSVETRLGFRPSEDDYKWIRAWREVVVDAQGLPDKVSDETLG